MRVHLNLSIIASLVAASIGLQSVAYAKVKDVDVVGSEKSGVQVYVNTQQRSLYQIALLSGISVSELRQLNKGILDKTDIVKVGERIILPTSSPLFASEQGRRVLPALGSQNQQNSPDVDHQVASALQALGQQDWNGMTADKLKDDAKTRLQSETEGYVRNQVRNKVINPVEAAAQNLLSKFGTAELTLSVSDEFSIRGSSLKLFSPWYDSSSTVIFSQMSIAEYDKRTIGNFGLGQRWDVNENWLIGYNAFLDHDFTRSHNRLGLGIEAWTDYLRFAANYYYPLSDWKESKDFDGFLERAARGFDIRAQAYLPSYPHLGASLMFEKYYGDEVALFGKDKLQKDPSAVTIGIDYTPVPMFTFRGEHKQGSDSHTEAKLDLKMNYRIGVPLKDQLDPDKVAAARSLKGSRYGFVDRNNNIVLEYKDQRILVNLGDVKNAVENTVVDLTVDGSARGVLDNVNFAGSLDSAKYIKQSNGLKNTIYGWKLIVPPLFVDGKKVPEHNLTMVIQSGGKTFRSNSAKVTIVADASRRPELELVSQAENIATIKGGLVQTLNGEKKPFNDDDIFNNYPASLDEEGAFESLASWWKIKGLDGNPIQFKTECEANNFGCAKITSVSKQKGDGKTNDSFGITIDYPGEAKVVLQLPGYVESTPLIINKKREPGSIGKIKIGVMKPGENGYTWVAESHGDKPWVIEDDKGGKELLKAGNKLTIEAQDKDGNVITDPKVTWSLVDTNSLACKDSITDLGNGDDIAQRFIVEENNVEYMLPTHNNDSLAFQGESKNGVKASPKACAGHQGFKLRIDVE